MSFARELREAIALDSKIDFDFWVRDTHSGPDIGLIWVGARYGSKERCELLMARLSRLGYVPVMEGQPGTAGEYIIDLKPDVPENNRRLTPYLRTFDDRVPRANQAYLDRLIAEGDSYLCSRTRPRLSRRSANDGR